MKETTEETTDHLSLTREEREVLVQNPGQLRPVDDRFFSVPGSGATARWCCTSVLDMSEIGQITVLPLGLAL